MIRVEPILCVEDNMWLNFSRICPYSQMKSLAENESKWGVRKMEQRR
jgi:hypothetical protein